MNISVIIPTYNRRHQIEAALNSILWQERIDLEVIVVDDGSSDGTIEWLIAAYPDNRIRILKNERKKGPAGARNTGILAAAGDFIAFLDSDDHYLDGHLAGCIEIFTEHPEVGLVFGRAIYEQNGQAVDYMGSNFDWKLARATVDKQNDQYLVLGNDYFNHLLKFGCYFNLSTVALRRQFARELMNEELRIAEDYEFWVRLARKTRFACLKMPQIRYQIHEQNISFEAAETVENNAPQLIKAQQILLDYAGLDSVQRGLIKRNVAEIYFDWAYRCRQNQRYSEALSKHFQSLKFGAKTRNIAAMVKVMLTAVFLRAPKTNH
jgi:glycosyltransferase involved in cell wall biosynthesis